MNAHVLNWKKLLQTENMFVSTIIISVIWPKIWPKIARQFETKSNNSTIKSLHSIHLKKPLTTSVNFWVLQDTGKLTSCFESAWLLNLSMTQTPKDSSGDLTHKSFFNSHLITNSFNIIAIDYAYIISGSLLSWEIECQNFKKCGPKARIIKWPPQTN